MSLLVRPSVPRTSGRSRPSSIPTLVPFAPGNVPNRLSNVRFSLITNTTCLIGQRVAIEDASTGAGPGVSDVRPVSGDGDDRTRVGDAPSGDAPSLESPPRHAAATAANAIAATRSARIGGRRVGMSGPECT